MKRVVLLFVSLFALQSAHAEGRLKKFLTRADSVLAVRYFRTAYDTNYVVY